MLLRFRKAIEEKDEGFTLIELLVVMIIIGILAAIAIPVFLAQRTNGYNTAAKNDVRNAATAFESVAVDNNGNYLTAVTGANVAGTAFTTAAPTVEFDASPGVTVFLGAPVTASDFCLYANNTSGGEWWVYDKADAGLDPNGYASAAAAQAAC